jgi:hypothetical protein
MIDVDTKRVIVCETPGVIAAADVRGAP